MTDRSGLNGRPWAAWTTRQWLGASVLAALAVLVVLGALGGWALNRASDATDRLTRRSSPALITSVRLDGALVGQETGIRGYGITGRPDFLQPYTQGRADAAADVEKLRTLLAGDGAALADLDALLARVSTWQRDVAEPVAASPAGAPVPLATVNAEVGKAEFDAIRDAGTTLRDRLEDSRNRAAAELTDAETFSHWVFGTIGVTLLLLSGAVFVGLRGITLPLDALSRDVRRVAAGEFDHPVDTRSGPADLAQLAADVEGMRRRLAEQLALADLTREQLDEQAADLRRSNTELEQFAYVASHDLQEPLRKVASFCQLLQRRYAAQLDDRANQYIGFAVDGANRMQTLINDLLAFSRVGRLHRQYVPVDLEKVFAATRDALAIAIEETGAEITADPLPTLPGDATQLGMLLQNLVSNALKFRAPDRPPRIALTARRTGEHWELAVTDNGIGINPEFAERIFVIFQRLHTREEYPGNGIGLAMCKKITEFHGGTIRVDTAHTGGTRVVLTLAAEEAEAGPVPPAEAVPSAQPAQPAQPAPGPAAPAEAAVPAGTAGTAG
ncbi:sensor histidine kinase [Kitasatospora phosalacinea]|uniref:sensor histidine kinase n=1 Tax=Kitasatospora phosalacinea TaxID=2065 RepID=UPI000690FDE7|nr:ATP-binding protein [Kitasatospora phosalacinea]